MTDIGTRTSLFDDNPTTQDLLGFDGVASAVVRVLLNGGLDPVTVGVQSPWGGGKSTVLSLVADKLEAEPGVLVVRVDPWEFENVEDVRGTLIALVLNELQVRITQDESPVDESTRKRVVRRLNDLRKRIAWGRVATVLVTSAATMTPNIEGVIEALTPAGPPSDEDHESGSGKAQTMAGFRSDFASLLSENLGIRKVIVLVDDLDRCLPQAIVGTLEAIKLFLSVKGMAFVLAADEDLIRAGIDAHLGGLANGNFAARYMEKIVQIPISLPVLTQQDAEAYIALLLAGTTGLDGFQMKALIERAHSRRRAGTAPYVVAGDNGDGPDPTVLTLAATAARVLSADMWSTPRAVKRLLNNLAIRDDLARAAGAEVPLDLLVKMYLLELRHLPSFTKLAGLASAERDDLMQRWEKWGRHEGEKPDDVDERTLEWAGVEPTLTGRGTEIDRYLSFAATLRAEVRFGGAMDPARRQLIEHLVDKADTVRRAAIEDILQLGQDEQEAAIKAVGEGLSRMPDIEHAVESLTELCRKNPTIKPAAVELFTRRSVLQRLEVHHVPALGDLPEVLQVIVTTEGLTDEVVKAAREELPTP